MRVTRRSVLGGSFGVMAAGAFARPHIANAAASTATMWVAQGFIPEEDAAYKAMVADYEKASSNKIDYTIIPFAPMRQKMVSAIATGVVPDCMETADFSFLYLNAWNDKLEDVSDIYELQKANWSQNGHDTSYAYNNATKKRSYYQVPWKSAAVPFHVWKSLVEKSGHKIADIPKTFDKFYDFFPPVQDGLRQAGRRNIYAMGLQLTATAPMVGEQQYGQDQQCSIIEQRVGAHQQGHHDGGGKLQPKGRRAGGTPHVQQ